MINAANKSLSNVTFDMIYPCQHIKIRWVA